MSSLLALLHLMETGPQKDKRTCSSFVLRHHQLSRLMALFLAGAVGSVSSTSTFQNTPDGVQRIQQQSGTALPKVRVTAVYHFLLRSKCLGYSLAQGPFPPPSCGSSLMARPTLQAAVRIQVPETGLAPGKPTALAARLEVPAQSHVSGQGPFPLSG